MKLVSIKPFVLAVVVFSAGTLNPVTSSALSTEASDLQSVGYYSRSYPYYLSKLYSYNKPRYHYKRGYRPNRHYRPHRHGRRHGYRHSYRHGYRGYR